jgi:hypothetical protein
VPCSVHGAHRHHRKLFLRCGFYSRLHTYGIHHYSPDLETVAEFLRALKTHSSMRGKKAITFYEKYATGLRFEIEKRGAFVAELWAEIDALEFEFYFKSSLMNEMRVFLLTGYDWDDVIEFESVMEGIKSCITHATSSGRTPTWDRVQAATRPNHLLISGDIEGILLTNTWVAEEVSDQVKAILNELEQNRIPARIFSIEWLKETNLLNSWELPYCDVTDVPVLDVGRCIAGTEEGCTNADLIEAVLDRYQEPQYFRLCDALISTFLLHYVLESRKIEDISNLSPAATLRMLLERLARIPAEYRKFGPKSVEFLSRVAASPQGRDHEAVRSLVSVVIDHAPVIAEEEPAVAPEERARKQAMALAGHKVWKTLHSETIAELIAAETAWLEIGTRLDSWPLERPARRRDCVHNLCCAFERELRRAVRSTFDQLSIRWSDVFEDERPSIGEMATLIFAKGSMLTLGSKTRFERTGLYKKFSARDARDLLEISKMRNRAAHGSERPEDDVTPVDVLRVRQLVFVEGAFAVLADAHN